MAMSESFITINISVSSLDRLTPSFFEKKKELYENFQVQENENLMP